MSDRSSSTPPSFFPFGPQQPDAWDVTFKVKYGETLKRFYGYVNGTQFDMNLSALRAKITNAFKFGPDADYILTYTDEDGDVVILDDDDDLRDAALHQKLNPLRITVQLKTVHPTEQKRNFTTVEPTTQDPLSQLMSAIEALKPVQDESLARIKSAVGDAIKSIPEPIPDALAKLSHEVLDVAPPPLAELMKPLLQLIAPTNSSNGPSNVHADRPSSSTSGVTHTHTPVTAKDEPKARESIGLRSVLEDAPAPGTGASQGQQPSLYPSVEELLFPSNSVDKSVCKGKSIKSSATLPAPPAVPTHAPSPPPFVSEWFQPSRCQPHPWQSEANAKTTNDSSWRVPMYKLPHAPPAALPYAPPGYGPSPRFPYPGRLLSSGHLCEDRRSVENSGPHNLHRWIQCDGCGVQPIVGPRYKSNVKEDYDLCDSCFQRMGNEVEYTKIGKPIVPCRILRDLHAHRKAVHHPRVLMKSKREKLESRFILDVTVLDGTLIAPSTPFIKIWRMHNNGSIMWPLGTQLIWVGGDQFALQTSVPLEIPVNGFLVGKEIDVAVDFVAPPRPGRYISYWRLASPSGQKFGQRVWVHIQVEDPSFIKDSNRNAAINLNLPPESSNANSINLIDVNVEPDDSDLASHFKRTKEYHFYPIAGSEPKKSQPAPSVAPPLCTAAHANPTADVPMSSATAASASFVPSIAPAPESAAAAVPSPVNVPIMPTTMSASAPASAPFNVPIIPTTMPVSAPVDVSVMPTTMPASAPAPAPAPELVPIVEAIPVPFDIYGHNEEKLLRELEEMGFKQIDLNKEILRQNNYNLEQSVDDLCGVNEWDPLLAELEEMGFDDTEVNKELLAKNGGSIKRAVMDLIAREKKDK